jgi:hypothetical protein
MTFKQVTAAGENASSTIAASRRFFLGVLLGLKHGGSVSSVLSS